MQLRVKTFNGAPLPKHAKEGDAGMDLTTRRELVIERGETVMAGTGVAVEIPEGHVGFVFPRSGLASKKGITLANAVGVIDSGYRGEVMAPLLNMSGQTQYVGKGERICQLVVVPFVTCECVEVDDLTETDRGSGGFGSTGRF